MRRRHTAFCNANVPGSERVLSIGALWCRITARIFGVAEIGHNYLPVPLELGGLRADPHAMPGSLDGVNFYEGAPRDARDSHGCLAAGLRRGWGKLW